MMLIVSVISGAGFGGVQAVNSLIMDAARGAGVRSCVVSLHDAPGAAWTRDWPGSFCAAGSRLRFAAGALARRAQARGSLIFVTHLSLAPVGRLVKMAAGGELCVFLHGVEAWRQLRARVSWGMSGADLLVSNSRFTLERFREANDALAAIPGRVCYLPARDLGGGDRGAARRGAGPLRVLVVGRLWGRGMVKGQKELISVWPRVLKDHPGAELWIVGEGEGRAQLEELACRGGVAGAVRFTGQVSDEELSSLYAASDIYAMPSYGEGFGLVFAEAMWHGLPCIASRFDAGSEVVRDGETGLLVDPAQPEELLAALRRLLADAGLRERMGGAGRRRAQEVFSLSGFNERMGTILRGEDRPSS
jgi:phosphatidylinositol alpha-1,6-mannosyltransferase